MEHTSFHLGRVYRKRYAQGWRRKTKAYVKVLLPKSTQLSFRRQAVNFHSLASLIDTFPLQKKPFSLSFHSIVSTEHITKEIEIDENSNFIKCFYFHFHCEKSFSMKHCWREILLHLSSSMLKRRTWQLNTINSGVKSSFINTRRKKRDKKKVLHWNCMQME